MLQVEEALAEVAEIAAERYRFVAIDVETASTDTGSICQIGLACVQDDRVARVVTVLIDPGCAFDAMNIRIHGITAEHVVGMPRFAGFLDVAGAFLDRHLLIQHSSFDSRAFARATEACGRAPQALAWHDSVLVARRAWPEFKGNGGHGLSHLKGALGLDFRHHDAGEDARAAAEVVLRAEARMGLPFAEILGQPAARRARQGG